MARLWDATTGFPLRPSLAHSGAVRAVAFSPDGKAILTGSEDRTARLWHAASGRTIGRPFPSDQTVAFHPDGKTILTAVDRTAQLRDVTTGRPVGQPLAHRGRITAAAFRPDGKAVVTSTYDGMIRIWDLATGQPIGPSLEIPRQGDNRPLTNTYALALEFGPDGRTVLGCLWNPQFTVIWDAATGEVINSFPSVVRASTGPMEKP